LASSRSHLFELSPSDSGFVAALVYVAALAIVAVAVALLHLGGRQLVLARSIVVSSALIVLWGWALVGVATT
jgi:hypothetical protein